MTASPRSDRPLHGLLGTDPVVATAGVSLLAEALVDQAVVVTQTQWQPPMAGTERDLARYVGASHAIAVSSCTAALHLSLVAAGVGPGDEVVVTRLDHDANVRPWTIAAERAGATVRWLDLDPATTELDDVATVLSDRTRLVAVTGASNLVGTRPPLRRIAQQVRQNGALFVVDAVHLTAHATVDLAAAGADVVHLESPVPHMIDPAWLDPLRDLVSRSVIPR